MTEQRILIIEDDPTMLRGLKDNFRFKRYRVETASDGQSGLETALRERPDLIVLDIMLPILNGYEVCKRIREAGLDMPIIILTAKGTENDIVRGLNLGANDYLTKPFSIRELLARAEGILKRRREKIPEIVRFGDNELNLSSHKLYRGGTETPLTPKEFNLLKFFAGNIGRALTRDTIMDHVWGTDLVVTSRSVDRCINTLRQKVEPDPPHPTFIQTIRDIGYRFEVPDEPTEPDAPSDRGRPRAAVGHQWGPFRLERRIDDGGEPSTFLAHDADGQEVLLSPLPNLEETIRERLIQDLQKCTALSPDGLVLPHLEHNAHDDHYLVARKPDGHPLDRRLAQGPLDMKQAITMGLALVEILGNLAEIDLYHLDLRPRWILLTGEGLRLTGFGPGLLRRQWVAREEEPWRRGLTALRLSSLAGGYRAPEVLDGEDGDARADLFSFGCVFAQMLTGRAPFARTTPAETLVALLRDDPPDFETSGKDTPELPRPLARILTRCLARSPGKRFQSAADLAFALEGLLE